MPAIAAALVSFAQVVLAVPLDGKPLRFGVALPAATLARGLRLDGRGVLQWRRMPIGGPAADPAWIELALVGPKGTVRVLAGGDGPCPDGAGPAYVLHRDAADEAGDHVVRERWVWCDGTVDERCRRRSAGAVTAGDDRLAAGEACTTASPGLAQRALAWCRLPTAHAIAGGLLPAGGGGGSTAAALRTQLARALPQLRELPGERGAGDFLRSGGVVTNLEFDTSYALLRCAVALRAPAVFVQAQRAARHLVDRDLDARSGLPFPHGPDHRSGVPEPGHTWLQGVLWCGLLAADDGLLAAAQALGEALALQPPREGGARERLRDFAWPLLELEALLRVAPSPRLAAAADAYAAAIAGRWDPARRAFRFGEDATGDGGVLERGWLAGGLLLPALHAHLRRRPDARLAARTAACAERLVAAVGSRGDGIPTHWRLDGDGRSFAVHREANTAAACFALDALPADRCADVLARSTVRRATADVLAPDDPDLPTTLTLAARCDWVWR